jgi:DNA-binding ferritin-like protein
MNLSSKKNDYSSDPLIRQLTILSASLFVVCTKTNGFSKNLVTPAFYENHTFLNLTSDYFVKARYEIDEAIRTLGGWAQYSIGQIAANSEVEDTTSLLTDPADMVADLVRDYNVLVGLSKKAWGMAIKEKEPAIVGLNISVSDQLTHFLWELNAMAGKGKNKTKESGTEALTDKRMIGA